MPIPLNVPTTDREMLMCIESLRAEVERLKETVQEIQVVLEKLNAFFHSLIAIGSFTATLFKAILILVSTISLTIGIFKYLGKI